MAILERVSHVLGMSTARTNQRARWWPVGLLVLLMLVGVYRVAFHVPSPVFAEEKAQQVETTTVKTEKPAAEEVFQPPTNVNTQDSEKTGEVTVDMLVVTPDGRAVADAEVLVQNRPLEFKYRTYRTDENGRVSIPWEKTALAHVFGIIARHGEDVGWHGHSPGPDIAEEAIKKPIKITLFPLSQTIEGTCVDGKGKPLAGVHVHVKGIVNATNGGLLVHLFPEKFLSGVVSDAEGRYSIELPESKACRIVAKHPQYVPVETLYPADNLEPKQFVLKEPAGGVRGRVVDAATGQPIREAVIYTTATERRSGGAGSQYSISDEDGRYTVDCMAPGLWSVVFFRYPEKPNWTAVAVNSLEVKAGETSRADFRVAPGRLLSGQVIDAKKNTPLSGVSVGYDGPARPRSANVSMFVETDAQGRFEFHVPPGESRIYTCAPFMGKPSSRTLIVEPHRDPPPIVFKGRLLDPKSFQFDAIPLYPTIMQKKTALANDSKEVEVGQTLDLGEIVIDEAKPDATPSLPTEQILTPRKNAAATYIQGTVVDQQGKPIAGARLWYAYAFNKSSGKQLEVDTHSDATGRFTLEIPPAPVEKEGVVRKTRSSVWAYSPEHCLGGASPKSKKANQDPAGIRLELAPATDTSLVVLDPDGRPMAGVLVEPINYRVKIGYNWVPDGAKPFVGGRTDAEGRVRLPAMARDRLSRVWLTTDNYGVQSQKIRVKASEPAERTIHLRPVCRIEGRVIAEKPEWAHGIRLVFTTEQLRRTTKKQRTLRGTTEKQRPPRPTEGRADVTTDKEGRFVVPIIAEGRIIMLQAVLDDKLPVRPELPPRLVGNTLPVRSEQSSFVDLSAGKTTVLEIPMCRLVDIRGSILAEDTGKPLPGVKIHVYYGRFRQGTDVVSDAKGQFSARVLPGRVRFQPMSLSKTRYLQLGEPQWHNVPDGADGFELPAIKAVPSKPLVGRLVDQDGSPVADAKIIAYYSNWLCSTATTGKDGQFLLLKMPLSVDPDKATYRVQLGIGETRFMRHGEVEILQVDPFVLRVERHSLDR